MDHWEQAHGSLGANTWTTGNKHMDHWEQTHLTTINTPHNPLK